MKKILSLLCLCLLLGCVSGCGGETEENISFTATVVHVYSSSIMVSTTDDVGFTEASVNISDIKIPFNLLPGQTVLLEIKPLIMETFPVKVTAVSVELLAENFLSGSPIPSNTNSDIEGVSMTIVPESVTSKGLSLVISDVNDPTHTFGEWYELKTYVSGSWEDTPVTISGDYGFNDIGLLTDSSGTLELTINWEWLYGNLGSGTYKIVKALYFPEGYKYFSAEFEIE